MSRIRTSIATAFAAVAVPSAAIAASVLVDHGRGPTYATIRPTPASPPGPRLDPRERRPRAPMVDGLPPGRTFGAHVHTGTCGP